MPIDALPATLTVKSRDQIVADYKRSYGVRQPDARTTDGTQPDLDARSLADVLVPVYGNAKTIADSVALKSRTGSALDDTADEIGIAPRQGAVGASGFVAADASAAGGTIFAGDELRNLDTGLRYQCLTTALYADGDAVPVAGIDTGAGTNCDAGVVLQWTSPRPGIGPSATVLADSNGAGLSGGRESEDDDTFRERIRDAKANPPASGNDAEIRAAVAETPGVRIRAAFTYPACLGPGTTGVAFTIAPSRPGGSRIPNATQIGLVSAYIAGRFPADDGLLPVALTAQSADVVLAVEWLDGAAQWADLVPWPPRYSPSGTPGLIRAQTVTDSTHFTLVCSGGSYTGVTQPSVGRTIAFFDAAKGVFRRKRILSFTGTGPWSITCDTSNGASDTTFSPASGQIACPWSDSLDDLAAPLLAYFDGLGPGEQFASFFDAGRRQRRSPTPPRYWPHTIDNRLIRGVLDVPSVQDAVLHEDGLTVAPAVGTPGVSAYLITLRYVAAFPS